MKRFSVLSVAILGGLVICAIGAMVAMAPDGHAASSVPISAMGMMTLVEYAKGIDKADIKRPFIEMFAASSDVYGALPFEGMSGPIYEGTRTAVLPTTGFRGINEGSTSGTGKVSPFQEASYIMDHDIDIDAAIVRRQGANRRSHEEQMATASLGRTWVDTFVGGDNTTDPREFNGLAKRSEYFSRKIANSASSGGAALSLAKLDTAINAVNKNGGKTYILAPFNSIPLWIAAARNTSLTGFVMQTWSEIGQPKMSYGGIQFLWGYEKDDHTPVLDFNEVASGGGSAVTASLYVVNFGEGKLRGLQMAPLDVQDKGLLENGITWRTHLSWDVGLVDEHKYCFSRLTSWTNAAIVA